MPTHSASTPFRAIERVVVSLYDGGVLSPAVLERVIGALAVDNVDWQTVASLHSVDGRLLHEIVVSTMMPSAPQNSVVKSFAAIVAHLADASATQSNERPHTQTQKAQRTARKKPERAESDVGSDELLAQLSESATSTGKRGKATPKRPGAASGFNPFASPLPSRRR